MRLINRILMPVTPLVMVLIVLLAACQGTGQSAATPTPAPQWETFHSDEGGFSVQFPAPPKKHLWSDAQSYGGVYTSTYQGMTFNAIFVIMAANELTPQQLMENTRDDHAAELKAKILSSEPSDFNGYPGLTYSLEAPDSKALPGGGIVQGRVYQVNDRLYVIYHAGAKKNSLLPDVKKYLGSLKVDGMVELPTPMPGTFVSADWQEFVSKEDDFTVSLPGQPERELLDSDPGQTPIIIYHLGNGSIDYNIMSLDMKDPQLLTENSEGAFNVMRLVIKEDRKGKIVSEKPIKLGKYSGLEITANVPLPSGEMSGWTRARTYLVPPRMYVLFVVGMDKSYDKDMREFFNSFTLTGK